MTQDLLSMNEEELSIWIDGFNAGSQTIIERLKQLNK